MGDLGRTTSPDPLEREADVVLRDGGTVHVRPVRPDDEAAMGAFLHELSDDSIGFRFFGAADLEWVTAWSMDVDSVNRVGLVAVTGTPSRIISHAVYVRSGGERAEVAFLVADAWQGRGISTIMLAQLAEIADRHLVSTFYAEVLPGNHQMIEVFRQSGFPIHSRCTPDAIEIEFPTSLSIEAIKRFEAREQTAAIAAVRRFLAPRSVAVVGALPRRGTIGGEILHNLIDAGFTGAVYAVDADADADAHAHAHGNADADAEADTDATRAQSSPAIRSVAQIPVAVDVAVVVVPAPQVVLVARQCAAAGVGALLVISAGFAETGRVGGRRQRELVTVCRESGMRLVGPNCLGVLNTTPEVALNATFATGRVAVGRVGVLSQSAGVGMAIIAAAAGLGVGLSSLVSVGNKADLSSNDLLQYWEQDAGTDLALLYLESFGNPRKFARVARRFSRRKPILAVKSGRSAVGARATSSHTGALLSASDVTADSLFHQAGVVRTDTLHELFDVGALMAKQPVPGGDRIAIVTNGGGPGRICADAARAHGARVPALASAVRRELERLVPNAAFLANPVNLTTSASTLDYDRTLRALIAANACDAIVTIFVAPLVTAADDVAAAISVVAQDCPECTLAAVFMTGGGRPDQLSAGTVQVPGYSFPEDAARAVALAARYGVWRARPEGNVIAPGGCRPDEAAAIITEQLAEQDWGWLSPERVQALLRCYGLPLAPAETAAPGVQMLVGMVHDNSFGPVLACAAGGPAAELVNDVAVRITPLTDLDAREMLRSLQTFPLLDGYRGSVPCNLRAIENVLERVGAMVQAHPEIAELDCDPVIAGPVQATIVDARIRVAALDLARPFQSLGA